MCGFAGFVDAAGCVADTRAALAAMARTLARRGPDDESVSFDAELRVGLAFRRLAVIDPSPAGRQPMRSPCGRFEIVFNGEVYGHAALRQRFAAQRSFVGGSDTESMLAAIEALGVERAVGEFRGMFAFALLDRWERALWLVRDRFGVKPLVYGLTGGRAVPSGAFRLPRGAAFVFGSDLRALRAVPGFTGSIDRAALTLLMRDGVVPAPFTIHAEARKLRPGHLVRVDLRTGAIDERRWFNLRDTVARGLAEPLVTHEGPAADHAAVEAVDRALCASVEARLVADVPVGALLSGGIDSAAVVGAMQACVGRRVRTFTVGFDHVDSDESTRARRVAEHLGTDHTELRLGADEAASLLPEACAAFDEPFGDASMLPTWAVARLARQHVAVVLSGDGGDELFGGYYRHAWTARVAEMSGRLPRAARGPVRALLASLPTAPLNAAGRAAARVAPGLTAFDRLGDRVRKLAPLVGTTDPWRLYRDLLMVDREAPRLVLGGSLPETPLDAPAGLPPDTDLLTRLLLADATAYLPDDILVKVDRATMDHGLEAREPLLDLGVAEVAFRLPARMRIRDGERKWVLRRVAERRVPPKLLAGPKQGFGVPLGGWLRGSLRRWADELLDEDRIRAEGYFDPIEVRARWDAVTGGKASASEPVAPIWTVLMFQTWLDRVRAETAGA